MIKTLANEPWDVLNLDRSEKWAYIVYSLIGAYHDEGIALWLANYKGDLDAMMDAAWKLRGGMIAS